MLNKELHPVKKSRSDPNREKINDKKRNLQAAAVFFRNYGLKEPDIHAKQNTKENGSSIDPGTHFQPPIK